MSDDAKGAQAPLFENPPEWESEWSGMPEFNQKAQPPFQTLQLHFRNKDDRDRFAKLVEQTITDRTKWMWYPKVENVPFSDKRYVAGEPLNPRFPVYVISKGRWEHHSRLTSRFLDSIDVPYRIVVEPQEYDNYAKAVSVEKILVLPFSNLGLGSIPARNWVWEHSAAAGASRHWILDDNIKGFTRLNDNLQVLVSSGNVFRAAEDFVERYENVAMAGFNYMQFVRRKREWPPYNLNTRIYSCILIKNDLPYRWRGRYNEDTDLSIRCLKDGFCTVLFNAFLADKVPTMQMKGGNTDELYGGDGRLKMAEALRELHPDIVKVTRKWGRPQHYVDYSGFKGNRLIPKAGRVLISDGAVDNYGMDLKVFEASVPWHENPAR